MTVKELRVSAKGRWYYTVSASGRLNITSTDQQPVEILVRVSGTKRPPLAERPTATAHDGVKHFSSLAAWHCQLSACQRG
jgi:hypothetical protein